MAKETGEKKKKEDLNTAQEGCAGNTDRGSCGVGAGTRKGGKLS